MQAGVLPGLESWLLQTETYKTLPSFRERLRSAALLDDLQVLGCTMPARPELPLARDRASVAGVCYVLEGSRLGAAHIRSQLREANASLPMGFLQHGTGHGYWKSFLLWLAAFETTHHEREWAVSAAEKVFEAYLQVLKTEEFEDVEPAGQR